MIQLSHGLLGTLKTSIRTTSNYTEYYRILSSAGLVDNKVFRASRNVSSGSNVKGEQFILPHVWLSQVTRS